MPFPMQVPEEGYLHSALDILSLSEYAFHQFSSIQRAQYEAID